MSDPQRFGSFWTIQKLTAVENYLQFFTTVLKNQKFKLCYIDAFSGSGNVTLKDGQVVDGSAMRALKYPFDAFYFFEKDTERYNVLTENINNRCSDMQNRIIIRNDDCNELLQSIDAKNWLAEKWRGVIFLDPYAMQLSWSCLEKINNTKTFDVWYLFPFMAVNRNLFKDRNIPPMNREALNKILGTADWENEIYREPDQQSLFGIDYEKTDVEGVKGYIVKRLGETFPTVAPNPVLLRNDNNAPLFLLCFAGSNPSKKAKERALAGANHILKHI